MLDLFISKNYHDLHLLEVSKLTQKVQNDAIKRGNCDTWKNRCMVFAYVVR